MCLPPPPWTPYISQVKSSQGVTSSPASSAASVVVMAGQPRTVAPPSTTQTQFSVEALQVNVVGHWNGAIATASTIATISGRHPSDTFLGLTRQDVEFFQTTLKCLSLLSSRRARLLRALQSAMTDPLRSTLLSAVAAVEAARGTEEDSYHLSASLQWDNMRQMIETGLGVMVSAFNPASSEEGLPDAEVKRAGADKGLRTAFARDGSALTFNDITEPTLVRAHAPEPESGSGSGSGLGLGLESEPELSRLLRHLFPLDTGGRDYAHDLENRRWTRIAWTLLRALECPVERVSQAMYAFVAAVFHCSQSQSEARRLYPPPYDLAAFVYCELKLDAELFTKDTSAFLAELAARLRQCDMERKNSGAPSPDEVRYTQCPDPGGQSIALSRGVVVSTVPVEPLPEIAAVLKSCAEPPLPPLVPRLYASIGPSLPHGVLVLVAHLVRAVWIALRLGGGLATIIGPEPEPGSEGVRWRRILSTPDLPEATFNRRPRVDCTVEYVKSIVRVLEGRETFIGKAPTLLHRVLARVKTRAETDMAADADADKVRMALVDEYGPCAAAELKRITCVPFFSYLWRAAADVVASAALDVHMEVQYMDSVVRAMIKDDPRLLLMTYSEVVAVAMSRPYGRVIIIPHVDEIDVLNAALTVIE